MTDNDAGSSGREMLELFPPFLRLELVDDDAFRARIGIELEGTISLDGGALTFPRSAFFNAVRALYGNTLRHAEVCDQTGKLWQLAGTKTGDTDSITISSDDKRYVVHGFTVLNSDHEVRSRQLGLALKEAGLPPTGLPEWRAILDVRPLSNEEVRHFDRALARTPSAAIRTLNEELKGPSGNVDSLVPPYRDYFELLVGIGEAADIAAYIQQVLPDLIANLLAWDEVEGAQRAFLLASHASIIPASVLVNLSAETLTAIARWALMSGDPLAKIGMVELGLAVLSRVPMLATPLQQLVQQILDLDADDKAGPLQLMTATFVLVDAQLSRLKILDDWPPFRRRIAAFAQAALLQRLMFG